MNRLNAYLMGVLVVVSSMGLMSCLTDNNPCAQNPIDIPWEGRVVIFGVVEGGDVSIHPHGSSEMKLTVGSMSYEGVSMAAAQLSYWVDGDEVIETYQANGRDYIEPEDFIGR